MNWKPEEKDVIDYLYGSMTIEKKEKFETYLEAHPELEQEVEEIRETMQILPAVQDEEVIPPVPLPVARAVAGNRWRHWLFPVSVAASIAIILLTGYFTNFRMSFNKEGFELGFVEQVKQEEGLNQEQVEQLIARRLAGYSARMDRQFTALQSGVEQQLTDNQTFTRQQINKMASNAGAGQLDEAQGSRFISQLREENEQMMQNFYLVSTAEQKTYLRNILLEYSDYIERQRQEDMRFFRASLLDIKSDSEIKQEATDKILANIISTVNNQNSPINDKLSLD